MKTMMRMRYAGALSLALAMSAGCNRVDKDSRAAAAAEGRGDVVVGLVWGDGPQGLLVEGAELAREEINAGGGIDKRPLSFVHVQLPEHPRDPEHLAYRIANELASRNDLVAVIGHGSFDTALAASVIYERQGIVYINPAVTENTMNKNGFHYVFSTLPDNDQIGRRSADFATNLGLRSVAILSSRQISADQLTESFADRAATLGIRVVARRSFFPGRGNYREILSDLGSVSADFIYLAADAEDALAIVTQSREMSFTSRFLLPGYVDPVAVKRALGDQDPSMIIGSILFNRSADRPNVRDFNLKFREKYGKSIDGWAAQGYDSVMVLAESMKKAHSTVPLSVASVMAYSLSIRGVTGRYSFNRSGAIYTKNVDFFALERGHIDFYSAEIGLRAFSPP